MVHRGVNKRSGQVKIIRMALGEAAVLPHPTSRGCCVHFSLARKYTRNEDPPTWGPFYQPNMANGETVGMEPDRNRNPGPAVATVLSKNGSGIIEWVCVTQVWIE